MICLIDNSNILNIQFASFISILKQKNGDDYRIKEEDLGLFWHLYMKKCKDFFTTYRDLIFCGEGHSSTRWRKERYPLYKENRTQRAENPDYDLIKKCYNDVDDFLRLFHCKSIRVENCEADDVIYRLTEYFTGQGEQVNIISSDKDLTQLCVYFDGVTVYNPMSTLNSRIKPVTDSENCNPNIILEKAIVGDPSDNIKGIPRIGKQTFEKMLSDKELWSKKMTPENQKLMETILDIVDLRRFPEKYHEDIMRVYNETPYNEFDSQGVEKFFIDHNLQQCLHSWSELSGEIQMMLNGNSEKSTEDEIMELLNS